MAKIFFRKSVVKNHIQFRDGKRIPFEALGSGWGVLELDEESDAEKIADLQGFITRKLGGVSLITADEAELLKKNHPPISAEEKLAAKAPRLMSMDNNPLGTRSDNARRATDQGNVSRVGGLNLAAPVVEPGSSNGVPSAPISRGRPVRTGRAKPLESVTVSAPMALAADAPVESTPTTEG